MAYLDEAAILAILEHIPDIRQRAQLSTVSRQWHICVASSWQRLRLECMDEQQFEKKLFWLQKQLPNNSDALQWLMFNFRGTIVEVACFLCV